MRSARVSFLTYSGNEIGKEGAEALARSLERNSSLTSLDLSSALCRYRCVPRACHFSRIQGIRSERKGRKHWREVWSATSPSLHSISRVHSADMDACRVRVISHVYSANQIGKEGVEALARSLEHNSSLIHLELACTLYRYRRACIIAYVYSDNKAGNEGAEALARSLERNSSLTSLNLESTFCRYGCIPRACHFSRVFRQ
jgi:Ran GTPase-activating protein (RanGAP) involved in mRNA processing and transport